ncbi:hypothetical protein H310_02114 [Aphanomyces invadans]|uniref:Uncharacterized protein n=1 Tax=Aphanomyces invadans TaxID=157072 RepID=A0A024UPT1_9STRA|nr:hypothetical protein H310_02114 [Aphanomyces invadans]ETW07648.1 hypothetical protein H310_02114 [Aphanomyces invadans]|eukprot:XP_008863741.1 hypothetical protein H310_02114 [Aphanomyces invadans]
MDTPLASHVKRQRVVAGRVCVNPNESIHPLNETEFQAHTQLRRLRYIHHIEQFVASQAYFKAVDYPPEPNENEYMKR